MSEKRDALRRAVYDEIAMAAVETPFDPGVEARWLVSRMKSHHGFVDADFPPTNYRGVYRAVDQALQYHRRAGRIRFTRAGWEVSRG